MSSVYVAKGIDGSVLELLPLTLEGSLHVAMEFSDWWSEGLPLELFTHLRKVNSARIILFIEKTKAFEELHIA